MSFAGTDLGRTMTIRLGVSPGVAGGGFLRANNAAWNDMKIGGSPSSVGLRWIRRF